MSNNCSGVKKVQYDAILIIQYRRIVVKNQRLKSVDWDLSLPNKSEDVTAIGIKSTLHKWILRESCSELHTWE